jgi:hypothetical protein
VLAVALENLAEGGSGEGSTDGAMAWDWGTAAVDASRVLAKAFVADESVMAAERRANLSFIVQSFWRLKVDCLVLHAFT